MHCKDPKQKLYMCWPSSTFVSTVTTHESKSSLKSDYIRKIATDTCLICSMPTPTSSKTPPGLIKPNECVPCTYTTNSGYNDVKLYPYSEYNLCDCAFKLRHARQRTRVYSPDFRRHTSDGVQLNQTTDVCHNRSTQSPMIPYSMLTSHKVASKMRLVPSNEAKTVPRIQNLDSDSRNQLPESSNRHSNHCQDYEKQQKRHLDFTSTKPSDSMRHSYPSAEYYPRDRIALVPHSSKNNDSSKFSVFMLTDRGRMELVAKPHAVVTRHQSRNQPFIQCSESSKNALRKMVRTSMPTPPVHLDSRRLEDYVTLFKEVQIH